MALFLSESIHSVATPVFFLDKEEEEEERVPGHDIHLCCIISVFLIVTSYGGLFESRILNLNCKFYMPNFNWNGDYIRVKCAVAWTRPNSLRVVGSRQ